jgi:hypothetical protein
MAKSTQQSPRVILDGPAAARHPRRDHPGRRESREDWVFVEELVRFAQVFAAVLALRATPLGRLHCATLRKARQQGIGAAGRAEAVSNAPAPRANQLSSRICRAFSL